MNRNECIVIIPSYEPSHAFVDYAKQLIASGVGGVIVVNDGSGQKYESVFDALRLLPKCTVLSYGTNHGKGYALKTAFEYAKRNYDERYIFVTADCDGQHLVNDVINVAEATFEFGDSFMLGVRDFSQPHVPKRSRLGNVFTRRVFKFLYGVRISDTQTGLRAFSYCMLNDLLRIKGERFEYEMNQLVCLHKRGVPIREVPISTVYKPKPDDVETVSHYNTFRDSRRVAKVLATNLNFFMLGSVLSAIVELLLQFLGLVYLPQNGFNIFSRAVLAQSMARVGSSLINFSINYKFVFNGHQKRCIYRYYALWLVLFLCSLGFSHHFATVFQNPLLIVLLTGLSTLVMSSASYTLQTRWVFAGGRRKNGKFWGMYSRFVRFIYRNFSKKYVSLVARDQVGAVYVCRHLNMHGPYTIMGKLGFDTHLMTFSVFCSFKEAYSHFKNYNFMQVRKWGKLKSGICAFFLSLAVVPLIHSAEGIPVYRKNTQSIRTLKRALECLEVHENVLLFPDIDYQADANTSTDIYTGFLLLEKMYFKKTGKHLRFIPLLIDDANRTIIEKSPIRFKNGDYKEQLDGIKQRIMEDIGCIVPPKTTDQTAEIAITKKEG